MIPSDTIEGKPVEQVERVIYLGHMATEDGKSESEIKRRIEIARGAFENMSKVLTNRSININTRKRLLKCYVWSTLLYGAETWTLTKSTMKKIEAFEMWCYRRMMRISYTEHKTNDEVLEMVTSKRALLCIIKKRKTEYFGQLIRMNGLQRLLLEGKVNGKRGKGRPRITWMENVKMWTELKYSECVRLAEDRERWKAMVANLLRADGT